MIHRRRPYWAGAGLLAVALGTGIGAGGCSLLDDFPGGGTIEDAFDPEKADNGFDPADADRGGVEQDPLKDPPEDDTVTVASALPVTIATPGESFTVHLKFTSQLGNVVGGGIRFAGSNEIQWTLFENLRGKIGGDILFGYVIDDLVCTQVPKLCHNSETEQFAVTQLEDGRFAVSKPVTVPMVLKCATCASSSCQDAFEEIPDQNCQGCQQPRVCAEFASVCFDETRPDYDPDQEDIFRVFLGPRGTLWTSEAACRSGRPLCADAFRRYEETDACSLVP